MDISLQCIRLKSRCRKASQGGPTNGELVEAQHIVHAHLGNATGKQIWPLHRSKSASELQQGTAILVSMQLRQCIRHFGAFKVQPMQNVDDGNELRASPASGSEP